VCPFKENYITALALFRFVVQKSVKILENSEKSAVTGSNITFFFFRFANFFKFMHEKVGNLR